MQGQIGLDARGVAVHHEADGAGRRQHRRLRVAHAAGRRLLERLVPDVAGSVHERRGHVLRVDTDHGPAMHVQDAEYVVAALRILLERPHARRDVRGGAVRLTTHDRGHGRRRAPPRVGVVRQAHRHQQGTEVGVTEAELTERDGVAADLGRRVVRSSHQDLLRAEHDANCRPEARHVELPVGAEERQQVQAGQVAGRVVEVEVLRAGVGSRDASGRGRGVPPVDGRVELHPRIGALPRRLGDAAEHLGGIDRLNDLSCRARREIPLPSRQRRLHELVSETDGVVGVLVEQRGAVDTVEAQVEPGLAEDTRLALLTRLAPDEVSDIGMIGVEHDHLGGAPRRAARANGPGRGVGTPHEAHRSARLAAAGEELRSRADATQVDAGTRPALEDQPFLGVPVQDRLHGVLHRQDEAGGGLGSGARNPDVEPHGRVERHLLGDEQMCELIGEPSGLVRVGEVAALGAPAADRADNPVDHLTERVLAIGTAEPASKVLLGDDVDGVLRPRGRELDAVLLEDGLAAGAGNECAPPAPLHRVEGVHTLNGEESPETDADLLGQDGHALTSPFGV